MSEFTALLGLVVAAGWATTYAWRFVGVYLAERIAPESELLTWVRAVATALVAALVAGLVLDPPGQLAATEIEARIAAMAIGVAAFYVFRRNTGAGVATAVVALFVISWAFGV